MKTTKHCEDYNCGYYSSKYYWFIMMHRLNKAVPHLFKLDDSAVSVTTIQIQLHMSFLNKDTISCGKWHKIMSMSMTSCFYLGQVMKVWLYCYLVNWFCYQMIAKPGNKTTEPSWPDPYIPIYIVLIFETWMMSLQFLFHVVHMLRGSILLKKDKYLFYSIPWHRYDAQFWKLPSSDTTTCSSYKVSIISYDDHMMSRSTSNM